MKKKLLLATSVAYLIWTVLSIPEKPQGMDMELDFFQVYGTPIDIKNSIKSACYDCHSIETQFPFYAYLPPISNWIKGHVRHGKGKLNYSTWGSLGMIEKQELLKVMIEEINKDEMPPSNYLFMHSEVEWSEDERKTMVAYFNQLYERDNYGSNSK